MRWMLFSLILLAAALLDGGDLLNVLALGSGHIRPLILTTVLVFCCLHSRRQDAISCAFIIGFVADLASSSMGPHMIVYGVVGTALNRISHTVSMKRFIHQCLVIFLLTLLTQFPIAMLETWKTGQHRPGLFLVSLGIAVYSAVFAPVVWFALSAVWKRIYPYAQERSRLR
jgi:rod shape-determining protein MreD